MVGLEVRQQPGQRALHFFVLACGCSGCSVQFNDHYVMVYTQTAAQIAHRHNLIRFPSAASRGFECHSGWITCFTWPACLECLVFCAAWGDPFGPWLLRHEIRCGCKVEYTNGGQKILTLSWTREMLIHMCLSPCDHVAKAKWHQTGSSCSHRDLMCYFTSLHELFASLARPQCLSDRPAHV